MAKARGRALARRDQTIDRLHQNEWGVWHWKVEKKLRGHFKGRSLGRDKAAAEAEAKRLNREVDLFLKEKATGQPAPPRLRARTTNLTVAQAIAFYRSSDAWKALRPRTSRLWHHYLNQIEAEFGDEVLRELKRPRVRMWSDPLKRRVPGSARSYVTAARTMVNWAADQGYCEEDANPFTRLKMPGSKKRKRLFTIEEVRHLVAVADGRTVPPGDEDGWRVRPSIGTAIVLAFACVQRITDIIALGRGHLHPEIVEGRATGATRLVFDQSKSMEVGQNFELEAGVRIDTRLPPMAAARLSAAPPLKGPKTQGRLVVNEYTRRPYSDATIANGFRAVLERAIACDPAKWGHLAGAHIRDCRRSGFVHLRKLGFNVEQIVNLSGHSLKAGYAIVQHYMPRTNDEADQVAAAMTGEM